MCDDKAIPVAVKLLIKTLQEDSARLDKLLDPEGPFITMAPMQVPEHSTPVFAHRPIHTRAEIDEVRKRDE